MSCDKISFTEGINKTKGVKQQYYYILTDIDFCFNFIGPNITSLSIL